MTLIMICLVILVILFLFAYVLLRLTSHPKFFSTKQSIEIEQSKGYLDGYFELPKEDYTITSYDGYVLHCSLIPSEKKSKKVVIITHGHTYTRWGSVKYLMIFRELGYNAVIYDDRGHGENKHAPVTMGYHEHEDLMCVINDTFKRFGSDCYIGLHGESMGSAISLQVLKKHPPIHFIVSDCGYSDLVYFTKMFARTNFHIPSLFIHLASLLSKMLYGYWLHEVSPITYLKDNQIPVCFIHGAADTYIDPCNAKRMYDADAGYKELHLFEHAGHAESYASDPDMYRKIVQDFIDKVEREEHEHEYKNA